MFSFRTDNKNYNFFFNKKDDKIVGITIDNCYLFTVEFLDDYLGAMKDYRLFQINCLCILIRC